MAVKKVFLGYPEMEMFTWMFPNSKELIIHINDEFNHNICANIRLDYNTAIQFRDELNRMIEMVENHKK